MHERIAKEVSYLRGFMAGDQTLTDKQQDIFERLFFVVEELAEYSHQLNIRLTELEDYVEAVDEDLDDVEQFIFEEDDDGEDDDDEDDDLLVHLICDKCGEEVAVHPDDLRDNKIDCLCPNCNTVIAFDETTEVTHTDEDH